MILINIEFFILEEYVVLIIIYKVKKQKQVTKMHLTGKNFKK